MASAKTQGRPYSAGEWGVNRVHVVDRGSRGLFLEFRERVPGSSESRRVRVALGHRDHEAARAKADEVAAAFRRPEPPRPPELTLKALFDIYEAEVSSTKGESKEAHDSRCAEMFLRYLGRNTDPKTLSRREWDRFITDRRRGAVAPKGVKKRRRVGERVIAYDLKWLLSVLNWATVAGDGQGRALLDQNPLKRMPLPHVEKPQRAILTDSQYLALRAVARDVAPLFGLLVLLAHETGHRIGAIRRLRWSDIDLDQETIHWRAESDKIGLEHTTLLTSEACAALRAERARHPAIGDRWIFPAPANPALPVSRDRVRHWWQRAAKAIGLPTGRRIGWHAVRRQWATEMKHTPLKDLCYMGGWKNERTLLTCYQVPDQQTQREAMASRGKFTGMAASR